MQCRGNDLTNRRSEATRHAPHQKLKRGIRIAAEHSGTIVYESASSICPGVRAGLCGVDGSISIKNGVEVECRVRLFAACGLLHSPHFHNQYCCTIYNIKEKWKGNTVRSNE